MMTSSEAFVLDLGSAVIKVGSLPIILDMRKIRNFLFSINSFKHHRTVDVTVPTCTDI